MGKLEVKGYAARTMKNDLMRIEISFRERKKTSSEASQRVMQECEDFLSVLEKSGVDISKIILKNDEIDYRSDYRSDRNDEYYVANRKLELLSEYDAGLLNHIRSICNKMESQVEFDVRYLLSNEEEIKQILVKEALVDAKRQAESMASAVDRKIVGLIKADVNPPKPDKIVGEAEVLCINSLTLAEDVETYEKSDKLVATTIQLSEVIYTTWKVE